jgi:S-adenosylmethionine hydrolase
VWIKILTADQELFSQKVKFASSFGQVELGEPVIYVNDILNIGIALNQGDMAKTYNISAGSSTTIEIWK